VTAKVPKIISFLAYLAPIAIWRIWSIHFPVYGLYELLSFLILVVSFAIYIRLAFRLIRSLVKRISGKREMSQGDVTQTFNNIPSDEA
jgi:ABC-type transport system involved in cytochrome c biogenesis permease subunit